VFSKIANGSDDLIDISHYANNTHARSK